MTPTGVQTSSTYTDLDVLILATGFDAYTGGLTRISITGTDEQTIQSKWSGGTWTYLGLSIAGFPNMFFPYGPQAPTALCNGPTCAELQGDYIVSMIEYVTKSGKTRMEAEVGAEEAWRKHVQDICFLTLFPGTSSWYMGANIPGKPREALNYLGGVCAYKKEIESVRERGFEGFVVSGKHGETREVVERNDFAEAVDYINEQGPEIGMQAETDVWEDAWEAQPCRDARESLAATLDASSDEDSSPTRSIFDAASLHTDDTHATNNLYQETQKDIPFDPLDVVDNPDADWNHIPGFGRDSETLSDGDSDVSFGIDASKPAHREQRESVNFLHDMAEGGDWWLQRSGRDFAAAMRLA